MRGIPRTLAARRSGNLADVAYAIDAVLDTGASLLRGTVAIEVSLARAGAIVLDSRPAEGGTAEIVAIDGRAVDRAMRREDHLVVPATRMRAGRHRIVCAFTAPITPAGTALTRYDDREDGSSYVYSMFVPADASTVFPCFDQPDLKARLTLALTVPEGWRVVANAPLRARSAGRHVFAPTPPLSTYLLAFAAGPFHVTTAGGRRGSRVFVRRSRVQGARRPIAETLALSDAALDWLERWTGRPLPFPKHDLVLVPEFQYGGMEHAGATFLRESAILLGSDASHAEHARRALLVAHENAHQWFGNLVTMRWFDDLWLKEGFASLCALAIVEAIAPALEPRVGFVAQKAAACATDGTRGTRPLVAAIDNLLAAKNAYGTIVYQKGPAVLRMTERLLGAAAFRRGVRRWLRDHAYGAADWRDLIAALEAASGRSLGRWAEAWITGDGVPTVRLAVTADAGGRVRRAVVRRAGGAARLPLAFDVTAYGAAAVRGRRIAISMQGREARVRALEGRHVPATMVLNAGDHAYGLFVVDRAHAEALFAALPRMPDALARALAIESTWNAMRGGRLPPRVLAEHFLAWLPQETSETLATTLLERIVDLARRYVEPAHADALAHAAEATLAPMAWSAHASPAMRSAALRAFVDVVRSESGRERLLHTLDAERPGEATRFAILTRLAVLGAPEAATRIARAARDARSDDTRRLAFAAGAALSDGAVKRRMFTRFLADPALPESWIEAALPAFAAPEHARLVRPLVARAIAALPALEQRFRIFFVNRWLAAIVGGQIDADGLAAVDAAIRATHLAPPLRSKALEARDALAIVVRARAMRRT
jgi:aminopeptidase N